MLRRKWFRDEFTSPRLGIRFDLAGPEMQVFYPDGRRFLTFVELEADRSKQAQFRLAAEQKLQVAEQKLLITEQRGRRLSELSRKARHGQAAPKNSRNWSAWRTKLTRFPRDDRWTRRRHGHAKAERSRLTREPQASSLFGRTYTRRG